MKDSALLKDMGTDAEKWAHQYCRRFPGHDEATLLGWFANAIEAGRSAGIAQGGDDMHLELTGIRIGDMPVAKAGK